LTKPKQQHTLAGSKIRTSGWPMRNSRTSKKPPSRPKLLEVIERERFPTAYSVSPGPERTDDLPPDPYCHQPGCQYADLRWIRIADRRSIATRLVATAAV